MALKTCRECGKEVSTEATTCPHCGVKNPIRRSGMSAPAKFIIGLVALVVILKIIGSSSGGSTSSSTSGAVDSPSAPVADPKQEALDSVALDFSWGTGGFDNVMIANFTITNKGSRPVRDLEITCRHHAPSGTEIDHNTRTIYEIVPAHGKKRIRNFNMGFIHTQAKTSNCSITDLVLAE